MAAPGLATTPHERPGGGRPFTLYLRDRKTGDLYAYRDGGPATRIGTGFHPDTVAQVIAGDFLGEGRPALICLLADGREAVLGGHTFFDAADLAPQPAEAADLAPQPADAADLAPQRTGDSPRQPVLRRDSGGAVVLRYAEATGGGLRWTPPRPLVTVPAGAVLLGLADVTGSGEADLLYRDVDGAVVVVEFAGPGVARHNLGTDFDGARPVSVVAREDGLADLLAATPDGDLLVFRHAGVFWPEFPAATLLAPVRLSRALRGLEIIG